MKDRTQIQTASLPGMAAANTIGAKGRGGVWRLRQRGLLSTALGALLVLAGADLAAAQGSPAQGSSQNPSSQIIAPKGAPKGARVGTPVGTIVDGQPCGEPDCTDYVDQGGAYTKKVGENTESETAADAPAGGQGFSISVDGERVAGDAPTPVDAERKTDLGLEAVDIQVKFDGLDQKPMLNVATTDVRRTYRAGDSVEFLATSNYKDWLSRQEVLIYPRDETERGTVRPIVVPVDESGHAAWPMPSEGPDEFDYVLRVYDKEGRFDETVPLSLARTEKDLIGHTAQDDVPVSPGNGDDRTALRNIPVYGGAVTVYGRNVPPGYTVRALGEEVPLDKDNSFVIQRILPPGEHMVDVAVNGQGKESGLKFDREINIPRNDWFYVALADLTVGRRMGDDGIETVREGEYDKTYTQGRAAFYLKGKIRGKYLLTAAADTREDTLRNIVKASDGKDPRNFLTRINPDEYYPVYGDDSTAFEDAPTRGKFYVRLERGESRVMWGNFQTKVAGSKFLRNERSLYGADAVYKSEAKTSFGESKVAAEAYAANSETLPQRDVLRATGGSAFFLKYQDITVGSEIISVQIRDPLSGRVLETRRLTAGVDYEIDHLQGVILLKRPLSSSTSASGVTRSATASGDEVYLIAQYERTPTAGEVNGGSFGGRAQGWLGDHLRVGVTGMQEDTGEADQKMVGADMVLRHSETTYLEAEVAQTQGPGFGRSWSTDGGMSFDNLGTQGSTKKARVYSVKGQLDLADVSDGKMKGRVGGFYEQKEAGFSSIDYDVTADQRIWGAFADVDLTEKTRLKADYEDFSDADDQNKREGTLDIEHELTEGWKIAVGLRHVGVDNVRNGRDDDDQPDRWPERWTGNRTDLGAKLTYSPSDDTSVYVFGQATVAKSGNLRRNDRIGAGGETRLTDRVGVTGEVSYGTSGWGALAALTYDPTTDRTYYVGYRLDPSADEFSSSRLSQTFSGDDGAIVAGARHRYNDALSAFSESNIDVFGNERSLATTYGVTYTPDTLWTISAGFEGGRIKDREASDFDRVAPSLSVSYKDEDRLAANFKAEARFEDSADDTRDQTSYYFAGGVAVKVSEDWRALANIDAVVSQSDRSSVRDGNYIEGSIGAAYRPVDNDKFNALFKYVYLQDLPSADQVSAVTGTELGPLTRAHILSVDGIYDLNQYLSLGAKYGFRISESAARDDRENFSDSSAHLGVVRADFHVIRNWDALLEGRVLYLASAKQTDWGALAAIYRHIGDNFKVGVGYNFGRFTDDLRDQTLNDKGVFLNAIGKF